jgi:hypothetical protein
MGNCLRAASPGNLLALGADGFSSSYRVVITISNRYEQPTGNERCFAATGYCIDGRIREYWEQNGGLEVFGLPITPLQTETIEGQAIQFQWFERNRLELHPENEPPFNVLLGRLGAVSLDRGGYLFPWPSGQVAGTPLAASPLAASPLALPAPGKTARRAGLTDVLHYAILSLD